MLKELAIDDAVECNDDTSSVKEILMKVQKNNRKLFVGSESGMGKNINNVMVTMHESMSTEGKD